MRRRGHKAPVRLREPLLTVARTLESALPAPPGDPPFTRDEALAFIAALRGPLASRTGFRWMVARFERLAIYVEALAEENERLRARLGEGGR